MSNDHKRNTPMSLWGIGPVFVGVSLVLMTGLGIVSFLNKDLFILTFQPWLMYTAGGLVLAIGLLFWIPAGATIDDSIRIGVLADKGPYGIVRHPIYAGILFVLTGVCLISRSVMLLAAVPLLYLVLRLLLLHEEKAVKTYFGKDYTEYAGRVNALIPKPALLGQAFFYPEPTRQLTDNLYIVQSGDANLFLYTAGKACVCIDAGYKGTGTGEALGNLGISPSDVSALFLTHTDRDHVGELDLFDRATVYLGEEEEPLVTGKKKRFPLLYSNKPLSRKYTLIKDGDSIRIGDITVEALATPGHTVGHFSYLLDGRYLFTGDAILFQNGVIRPFYRILSMRHEQTKESAEKIRRMRHIDYVCTAHNGVFEPGSIRLENPEDCFQ